jgi:GNAT superfamily N-acetyltransferase
VEAAKDYDIGGAASDGELLQILALQAANLPTALSEDERASQGFVTLEHDLGLLREMNTPHAHTLARCGGRVVGYALVMLPCFRARLPLLEPMFARFDALEPCEERGRTLAEERYFVMGQVCVAADHRGRGLLARMYAHQREQLAAHFDFAVTEIDGANQRSLAAHARTGYRVVDEYEAGGRAWVVVLAELASS